MDQAIAPTSADQVVDVVPLSITFGPSLDATWLLLCGVLASGFGQWRGENVLRILAAWLIADILLGCVLAQFRQLKRANLSQDRSQLRQVGLPQRFTIPYAEPDSPGGRLAEQINYYVAHWGSRVWPRAGRCATAGLAATGMALILATYLGKPILVTTSVSLVLAGIGTLLVDSDTALLSRWLTGLHLTTAWLIGHLSIAPWNHVSFALAVLMGLWGYARVYAQSALSHASVSLARILWIVVISILLVARQPLLAVAVAVVSLAEQMTSQRNGKSIRMGWLMSVLLVALAAMYWV